MMCQAQRFGGLEVDAQLNFRGLLHRQVGRFLTLENTTDIDASQAKRPIVARGQ